MEWMILPLKRYAQFRGRSRRKEYWLFLLFVIVGSFVFSTLDVILGLGGHATSYTAAAPGNYSAGSHFSGGILNGLWSLATIIPMIAVTARRLHDIDKSGWWMLIGVIPLIGWIIVIVWYCTDGTRGPNRFGPDPKAELSDLHETFR